MQSKSILIVEDDESIRDTLWMFLEFEGYSVYTASNGQEGVNLLPTMPDACLILLDLMMPVMDGWQFAEAIRLDSKLSSIPIVVITAFSEKAASVRANGMLKKPVNLDSLLKVVQQYCGSPQR
jgi:CheY-like chemotaxis protein